MPSVYLLLALVAAVAIGAVVYLSHIYTSGDNDSCLVPKPLDRRCEWYLNYKGFCPKDLDFFNSESCPEDPALPRFVKLSDKTCYPKDASQLEAMDKAGEFCFYPGNSFPSEPWPSATFSLDSFQFKNEILNWAKDRYTGDCSSEWSKTWFDPQTTGCVIEQCCPSGTLALQVKDTRKITCVPSNNEWSALQNSKIGDNYRRACLHS